jgi:hypothetical protein
MKENNIVTYLGLMEDDLWNNTDVTAPSFDIALAVINDIRRRLLEGKLVEVVEDKMGKSYYIARHK